MAGQTNWGFSPNFDFQSFDIDDRWRDFDFVEEKKNVCQTFTVTIDGHLSIDFSPIYSFILL